MANNYEYGVPMRWQNDLIKFWLKQ